MHMLQLHDCQDKRLQPNTHAGSIALPAPVYVHVTCTASVAFAGAKHCPLAVQSMQLIKREGSLQEEEKKVPEASQRWRTTAEGEELVL